MEKIEMTDAEFDAFLLALERPPVYKPRLAASLAEPSVFED